MKVDLSAKEIEMLDDALKEWQGAPSQEAFGKSLLSTMLTGISKKEDQPIDPEMDPKNIRAEADIEVKKREKQALLLRAKLMQASAIESEHVLE